MKRAKHVKTYLLLVTWFVTGQPPSSYQATFTSAETCAAARAGVLAEGQRLKTEFEQRAANAPDVTLRRLASMERPPMVTAVCALQ
jgi:hypothetical protein